MTEQSSADQTVSTDATAREVQRKRLHNLVRYYKLHGKVQLALRLQKQLDQLPIGGILPDQNGPMVACCGHFRSFSTIPFTTPCCGRVFFTDI